MCPYCHSARVVNDITPPQLRGIVEAAGPHGDHLGVQEGDRETGVYLVLRRSVQVVPEAEWFVLAGTAALKGKNVLGVKLLEINPEIPKKDTIEIGRVEAVFDPT